MKAHCRAEIVDPNHELRPGMLANFLIRVEDQAEGVAAPNNGVVRESDGTKIAWVTTDCHCFSQGTLKLRLRKEGWPQVTAGLLRGELVVADGAVVLSNIPQASPTD